MRRFFSSFKAKLLLLVTIAILLPLLAAGMILGNILQQRVYASFKGELQVALETIELLLARWEEELANSLDRLADDKEIETRLHLDESYRPAADSLMRRKITAQRKILGVDWLALFDLDRQLRAASRFKSKNLALDFSMLDRFQISASDSAYYLTYMTPVKKSGEVLGYLAGGLHLNDRRVASYLHEKGLKNFALWVDGEPVLSDLPDALAAPAKKKMSDLILQSEEYKGQARSREYGSRRLQYAVLFPVAFLQRDLNKLTGLILAIVGALFLTFAVLLAAVANKMTQPLHHLIHHARQLSSNHFIPQGEETLARLAARTHDEIGALADSFLQMERQLQIHLRDLAETTRANEKIQSELRIARHIQMSMLPHLTPELTNGKALEIAAAIAPAEEVGGDFYDFFMLDADRAGLVIGDVSDKSLPAALFMVLSKTLLRAVALLAPGNAADHLQPHEVLQLVNRELCRDNDLFLFVTIFFGVLNTKNGELQYSSGGHHPPFFLSAEHGVLPLQHRHSAPLGVKPATRYQTTRLAMRPGEGLFFYTDGVIEAMNGEGQLYSDARLAGFLKQHQNAPLAQMTEQILVETKKFSGATPQHDDIAVLAVKYRAA